MSHAGEIKFPRFPLICVNHPSSRDLDAISQRWNFAAEDLRDGAGIAKRTLLTVRPDYLCLVTLWPTYRRSTGDIQPVELSFFLRADALVMIARGTLPAFTQELHQLANNAHQRQTLGQRTPEPVLASLLNRLYLSLFPMIDHLIDDCDAIEREIFSHHERQMISHILSIRRNITDVRKILQVHKHVLKRLILYLTENPRYALQPHDRAFIELMDSVKEEWDTLENLKERIEGLQQTNESQISFRLADIMKTLTIISVFTFPLTLVAAVFSVALTSGMPWISRPGNFWYLVGLELSVAAVMFAVFKRKRWF